MKILCPSYRRTDNVLTRKWLSSAVLVVCESEADAYRQNQGGEILVLPESKKGNIARIRNWILDTVDDNEIVMIDDDVWAVGFHERGQQIAVNESRFLEFLRKGFDTARELKCYLWGVNVQSDPMFYHAWKPIAFNLPVLGPLTCHIRNPLRYDISLGLKEDYDFFLQHCQKYRRVLRFDKWYYMAKHIDNAGGCNAYRTSQEEREQAMRLVRKWGSSVVRYNPEISINPKLKVPF